MRHSVKVVSFFAVMIIAATCVGQASPKKSTKKAQPPPSSFACPDPDSEQACRSYDELLKGKDEGLLYSGFVCFLKKQDVFFTVGFLTPSFPKHWDKDLNMMVPNFEQRRPGWAIFKTYANGIEDAARMPFLRFSGEWGPWEDSAFFDADKLNGKELVHDDATTGMVIDGTQLNVGIEYKSVEDKIIEYKLTIQRSTGRFSQSFKFKSEKLPFIEDNGRCLYRKGN